MRNIAIGNLNMGDGRTKICVPITSYTADEIVLDAQNIAEAYKGTVDLIELRIDCFKDALKADKVKELLERIRAVEDIPLLFTFRTDREGGNLTATEEEYENTLINAIGTGLIDAVDVEMFYNKDIFSRVLEKARKNNVKVIGSNHDFNKTPPMEEMLSRLMTMEKSGADICKIAVMPNCEEDVLELLRLSLEGKRTLNIPFITISMGGKGVITRLSGGLFGSALTFGAAKNTSAPGQIDANLLKNIMNTLEGTV